MRKKTPEQTREDFWLKVDQSKGNDACWLWTGAKTSDGYGCLRVGGPRMLAHRYAWILTHGDIPAGLFVLHHCDNPPCCNPEHLFLGTHADNMCDAMRKGRHTRGFHSWPPRGELSGNAKLTDVQVKEIRELRRKTGLPYRVIAARYGAGYTTIQQIITETRRKEL